MKAVIVSVILLVLVIIATFLNIGFINSRVDQMKKLTQSILSSPEERENAVDELFRLWEKSHVIFSMSTGLREVDRATENLLTLRTACEEDNEWAIKQSCVLFCNALDDIARYENLSLEAVL